MFDQFPALQQDGFELTSPATAAYNCVAWAADDNKRWWEPDPYGLFFWPPDAPRNWSMASMMAAFETLEYVSCDDSNLEEGIEKIAIYENSFGSPTHVAWQKDDGRWSSKLGEGQDIVHNTVEGLYGQIYGVARVYMKRDRRGRLLL